MNQSSKSSVQVNLVFRAIQLVLALLKLKDIEYQRKLIKKIICFNQSKLSSYILEANLLHSELTFALEKFRNIDPIDTQATEIAIYNLSVRISELDEFLGNSFYIVFGKIFEDYLASYFKDRSAVLPRMCIKVLQGKDQVCTLFSTSTARVAACNPRKDNSAFSIAEKPDSPCFICNNIPLEFKSFNYKNSRIIQEKVQRYKPPTIFKRYLKKFDFNYRDKDWIDCWEDSSEHYSGNLEGACFYKSTLVVPISMKMSELSDSFKQVFATNNHTYRVVFGFLCFDHRDIGFFNHNCDVDLAYIISDILSLYYTQNLRFTRYSQSYKDASDII